MKNERIKVSPFSDEFVTYLPKTPSKMSNSPHSSLLSVTMESPKRKCSARLLSQSVQQTLRQLKKDEHNLRVAQLIRRNEKFYRRQKVCESFTTFSILLSFSGECDVVIFGQVLIDEIKPMCPYSLVASFCY